MNAPHYSPTVSFGNVLIVLSIVGMGATTLGFVWNLSAAQATFQTDTERRLAEGEKVRLEKVPQLDAMQQVVGITNERLTVHAKTLSGLLETDRELLTEIGKIRERLATIETTIKLKPEPVRP